MAHDDTTLDDRGPYADLTPEEMRIGLEVADIGVGRVDYIADTVSLDALAARIFGLPDGVPIPRAEFHARIHREDWPEVEREVDVLLAPEEPDVIDVTHRIVQPDDVIHWVHARKRVWFDIGPDGKRPVRGVFAVQDITNRQRAEMHSRYLIGELNHRTKNLINVVIALVRQLARHSRPEDLSDKITDRLRVLARNQDATVHQTGQNVSLQSVIAQQLAGLTDLSEGQVRVAGEDIGLGADAAQVMAMVLHELLTNATKHGALSTGEGRVDIGWTIAGDSLDFDWRETGGPAVKPSGRTGFGTQILTSYVQGTLGAEHRMSYDPEGFRFGFTTKRADLKR